MKEFADESNELVINSTNSKNIQYTNPHMCWPEALPEEQTALFISARLIIHLSQGNNLTMSLSPSVSFTHFFHSSRINCFILSLTNSLYSHIYILCNRLQSVVRAKVPNQQSKIYLLGSHKWHNRKVVAHSHPNRVWDI